MRGLVVGGCGLVGSHIVDSLLERGWEVRILDNLEPQTHSQLNSTYGIPPSWTPKEAEFIFGDVRALDNSPWTDAIFGDVDVVFHQAAFGGFSPDPRKMVDVNTLGTVNVLVAAAHAGVGKVVVASSQAVYGFGRYYCPEGHGFYERMYESTHFTPSGRGAVEGDIGWEHVCPQCGEEAAPLLLREDFPIEPSSPYAVSKYAAERLAMGEWPMPVVALRYSMVYGPRQSASNPYTGVTSLFSNRILHGLPPVIYEDGLQTRDFTFVEDVARANLLVAEDSRANGCVFNVGTGVPTSVLDFTRLLCAAYGSEVEPLLSGEYRPQDARHVVTDASKLRALGWEPQVPVADGVERFAAWFAEQARTDVVDASDELRAAGILR